MTFSILAGFGQHFEGKITYRNAYKSKMPNVTDEQFTGMMGSTQEYFIKGGDYKSLFNGSLLQWQLYINEDNKLYTKMSDSEAAIWNDGAMNSDEVLKSEINKEVVDILGYKCDELILTCKSGMQKYYFNTKLSVDAKLFANHKFGNWYDFVSRTNSLPLKFIYDSPQFYLESIATDVHSEPIDKSLLTLPVGTKTEKSPY